MQTSQRLSRTLLKALFCPVALAAPHRHRDRVSKGSAGSANILLAVPLDDRSIMSAVDLACDLQGKARDMKRIFRSDDLEVTLKSPVLRLLLAVAAMMANPACAETTYPPVDVLLQTETTVIGQTISYPEGPAQITVAIVTMEQGKTTGWHRHEAPLTAHVLEGELTVDYGPNGKRVYRKGDTLVEALGSRHNGKNTGDGVTKVLVVFSGAIGTPNTEPD